MPKRPTKRFMRECEKATGRRALCGWVWHHGMSKKRKRYWMSKENPQKKLIVIYEKVLGLDTVGDQVKEIRAIKGKGSLWPGEKYRHKFTKGSHWWKVRTGKEYRISRGTVFILRRKVYGVMIEGNYYLPKGTVILFREDGKSLWKNFHYGEEDLKKGNRHEA